MLSALHPFSFPSIASVRLLPRLGAAILCWAGTCGGSAAVEVRVELSGLEDPLLANAQAYLDLAAQQESPELTESWLRHLHRQAPEEIRESLTPFGYYRATVEASLSQTETGAWRATYQVDPGPRVMIRTVDIRWDGEGKDEPTLQQAAEAFPLQPGDPLLHAAYEAGKKALLEQAQALGYADVTATQAELRVMIEQDVADIVLVLDTGDRYYVGELRLYQDVLTDGLARRYLSGVQPGDVFVQDALLALQQDFIYSGYYSLVDIRPRFDQAADQRVPVDLTLAPAGRQRLSLGMGYDTDIQANVTLRWTHRRLNVHGHRASFWGQFSLPQSTARANYWIPIFDPRTHRIGFSSQYEREDSDNVDRRTVIVEPAYYWTRNDWEWKGFVEDRWEQFTTANEPEETINLISLGTSVQRRNLESGAFPRKGWTLFTEVRGAPTDGFGNTYVRALHEGSVYAPVGSAGRLFLRTEWGLASVGDFTQYPSSLRFFAGGDASIRGYEWKSVGPTNEDGEVIGGRNVLTLTGEYDHQILSSWALAAFIDAGNAYNEEIDELLLGAGTGLRFLAPFGAVRFDFAWPLNEDPDDPTLGDFRIHFGFEVNW